jgi:2-iminobutanoate/2-iminopropanoate deaminase
MKHEDIRRIDVASAPAPIGHYSHVVELDNGIVHLSGQKAWQPGEGALVTGGIVEQTERVLDNVEAILGEIGLDWSRVTRVHCYLADPEDFPAFDAVFARRLGAFRPARATVAGLRLRGKALVELAVDAYRGKAR